MDREALRKKIEELVVFYNLDLGDCRINPAGDNRDKVIRDAVSLVDVAGKSVFEIACSFGHFHRILTDARVSRLCGVDYFSQEIEACRLVDQYLGVADRFSSEVYDVERGIIRDDVRQMFGIDRFDVVYCLGVLYHLLGPLRVLLQLPLLLPVGGHLILETHLDPRIESEYAEELGYMRDDLLPLQMTWIGNAKHTIRLVESLGFEIVATKGYQYPGYEDAPLNEAKRLLVAARKVTDEIKGFTVTPDGSWIRPLYPGHY